MSAARASAAPEEEAIHPDSTTTKSSWLAITPAQRAEWRHEFKAVVGLALPTILQTASQQAMIMTDQIFLGHLGTNELGAAALGNAYSNLMWYFLLGVSTALDTLGSHAFGANDKKALVTWCFTASIVVSILLVPIAAGLSVGRLAALHLFSQSEEISVLVGEFCSGLIPGMWPLMWAIVLMKYLQTQNIMLAPALITLVTFGINIGCNAFFIHFLGFKGAPLATSLSRLLQFFMLIAAVAYYEHKQQVADAAAFAKQALPSPSDTPHATSASSSSAFHPTSQAHPPATVTYSAAGLWSYFKEQCILSVQPRVLWKFLRLGIPGGFGMAFEAGSFDITTVMAGRLGPTVTAAHTAILSIATLTYVSCPFAVATAGSIRVGNLLGAGQPSPARKAGLICIAIGTAFMAVMAIIILATKNVLGWIYTKDVAVVHIMASVAPLAALFQVSDGLMGTSQGVLRGAGRQQQTMVFNFCGFWVCGVLLGWLLCFKAHRGIQGLWTGIALGDTVTAFFNIGAMWRINWKCEADKAQARMEAMKEEEQECRAVLEGAASSSSGAAGGDGSNRGRRKMGGANYEMLEGADEEAGVVRVASHLNAFDGVTQDVSSEIRSLLTSSPRASKGLLSPSRARSASVGGDSPEQAAGMEVVVVPGRGSPVQKAAAERQAGGVAAVRKSSQELDLL